MPRLTRRFQVLFSPEQLNRLTLIADREGTSVGALIRRAVDDVYLNPQRDDALQAVEIMASLRLPVADWEQMERESVPFTGDD